MKMLTGSCRSLNCLAGAAMPYVAPAQLAPSTPFAALMQSTLNTMGPKNAATFMNSLAEGMSKVTNQYIQKLEAGGGLKPPMIPVMGGGGGGGDAAAPPLAATGRSGPERGGGLKRRRSNVAQQHHELALLEHNNNNNSNKKKRDKVFQIERSQLEKLLNQAQIKDQPQQQQASLKKKKEFLTTTNTITNPETSSSAAAPNGRQQIGPLPGAETLTSQQAGSKLKAMDKGAKGKLKESQGSLQQNVMNSILASKAQSIKFGNGLKPSKKVCFCFHFFFSLFKNREIFFP